LDGLGAGAALDAGAGTGAWTGTTTGYTSHKYQITTNGSSIPHPQKTGIFKAVVKLAVEETGMDLILNPQVTSSAA